MKKVFTPDWLRFFGLIAIIVGTHFGDNRYVTKVEYAADQVDRKETFKTMREALVTMDKSIALLETTRRVQDDHETRIRALEHSKISYEIKKHPLGSVEPFGSLYAGAGW